MEFKDYLKTYRRRDNLTQSQLARRIGCSQSSISAWENGVCLPGFDLLRRFRQVSCESGEEGAGNIRRRRAHETFVWFPEGIVSLKRLRLAEGWSRAEFASRLGVSEKTVANWERGGIPHLEQIKWIVNHFGIGINELN